MEENIAKRKTGERMHVEQNMLCIKALISTEIVLAF